MGRGFLSEKADTRELLFGTKDFPGSISRLAKKTGIPECSLRRYRKNPETMTLEKLRIVSKAVKLTPEQAAKLIFP